MDDSEPRSEVALDAVEARIVGCLIEKAFLTPDIYPMTTNAIVSASNQKTNRDPVMALDARTVDAALLELRQRHLVRKVHTPGARSTKHRHTLDEKLRLNSGELALISVLLLRGAQTVGELRTRTERQHGFESLESTEAALESLAANGRGLVRQLERQPGQKEARWMHLLEADADGPATTIAPSFGSSAGAEEPAEPAPAHRPASPTSDRAGGDTAEPVATSAEPTPASPSTVNAAPVTSAGAVDRSLSERVTRLESELEAVRRQLSKLAASLGEPLD